MFNPSHFRNIFALYLEARPTPQISLSSRPSSLKTQHSVLDNLSRRMIQATLSTHTSHSSSDHLSVFLLFVVHPYSIYLSASLSIYLNFELLERVDNRPEQAESLHLGRADGEDQAGPDQLIHRENKAAGWWVGGPCIK